MNISKHVKKGIKKNKKQEQSKSLADAMKKVKSESHEKKFSKGKGGGAGVGASAVPGDKKKKKWTGASGGGDGKFSGKKRSSTDAAQKQKQAELDALTPSAKKRKIRQDRQAKKPNFSLVENMKEFWNSARVKTLSKEDRELLIEGMMKSIQGRILQVTLRHDASRAVQCILQFGSPEQRRSILEEMSEKLYEIAKTPYGHFAVLKAASYCTTTADQSLVHHALRGHFVSLGTNVIGARCCESVMQLFPKKLTRDLKAEFYGKKFISLLEAPPASLQELIAAQPAKREPIMDHMRDLIQKFVDKGLLEFTYAHHLAWEYTQQCLDIFRETSAAAAGPGAGPSDPKANPQRRLNDLVGLLSEAAPKLLSTKPGAKVICVVTTYAAAKDRKKLMKSLKGHVAESLMHGSAHLGVMRLVDVTDDTVNVQKMLLDEVRSPKPVVTYAANGEVVGESVPQLVSIARHPQGCKLLLRLLAPHKQHLEPDEEELFQQDHLPTSKKAPGARRQEHVAYLRGPLLQVCTRYAAELARCKHGSRVLLEVIATFFPAKLMHKLVLLLSGQQVVEADEDEDEGELEGRGEDSDEESDEGSEEEEMEEMEGEGEDEDDEMEGEDEDDEMEVVADEEGNFDDEEEQQRTRGGKRGGAKAAAEVEVLALEEDQAAHKLLRKVLALQAEAEAGQAGADWEQVPCGEDEQAGTSFYPFACQLAEALRESGSYSSWVTRNRAAFLLADLAAVPSARAEVLGALQGAVGASLQKQAEQLAGAKSLWEVVSAAVSAASSKKKKTPSKKK